MQLFGIIGHPLSHTMSPLLHNWGFRELGIEASYHVWDTHPDKLGDFMTALRTLPIHGVSVTIPHKQTIMPFLDRMTKTATDIGAVNTLYWEDGLLWGDNTDVTGFMAPLEQSGMPPGTALVLGAGGAARAAVCGLVRAGWDVTVTARTAAKAEMLATDFKAGHIPWDARHDLRPALLVNTTPLGMSGRLQDLSPWETSMRGVTMAYDLVYNPRQTPFLCQAQAESVTVQYGLPMFAGQGLAQFRRWTGLGFDMEAALTLLENRLQGR